MSVRFTERSDSTADVLVFSVDPSAPYDSHITVEPTFTLAGVTFNQGVSFPIWSTPENVWLALGDGSGGYTNLTPFDTANGMNFRLMGNATDGYTFLQS